MSMRRNSAIRVAISAAILTATACSSAEAQEKFQQLILESGQAEVHGPDTWRCVTRSAYYSTKDIGIWPTTKVVTGKIVFHTADPDSEWSTGAEIRFMSIRESGPSDFNGFRASIYKDEPSRIYISAIVDGEYRQVGWYPVGTPVPFKATFNDAAGTMRIETGKFGVTTKPQKLFRPTVRLGCSGADVSFAEFDTQVD